MPDLDSRFEKLISYLVDHESTVATAAKDQRTPRPWMDFSGSDLERPASEKTEAELDQVFDRAQTNQQYVQLREQDDAKSRDIALVKLAGDFLAGFERDKRMQWRSRVRIIAHAAARRAGNGAENGPLRRNTVDYLERIFMKARSGRK